MAGVVVVAVLAVAVPSLALGSSHPAGVKHGRTTTAIMCPLGTAQIVPKADTKVNSRHRHHHRRHHGHAKPLPNVGATGPTGATVHCLPFPCIYNFGRPSGPSGPSGDTGLPCPPPPCFGASGSTGTIGVTGPSGVDFLCRPIPCIYGAEPATGWSGTTGTTGVICPPCVTPAANAGNAAMIICRPFPCPLGATVEQGTARAAIVACPPSPVCPPATGATDVCPLPCAIAGGSGQGAPTRVAILCSPGCPPEPVAGVRTMLHACPQLGAGASVSRSQRLR